MAGKAEVDILICRTEIGISIAANKVKSIHAAVYSEPFTAQLSKQHNNTNVSAFGGRVVGCTCKNDCEIMVRRLV